MKTLSVILPAHNEAALIGPCLKALFQSDALPDGWQTEALVIANGCTDTTVAQALKWQPQAVEAGWSLQVIDLPEAGKLNALNTGDEAATGDVRVYLDADVIVSPSLIRLLGEALDTCAPRYASGLACISPAQSLFTRWYGRFWETLPFVQAGVPGFGIFAVNAPGRALWQQWPDIISDDTFARLNFAPPQRIGVDAPYLWPLVEGFANLVRVRRRQNQGVAEIADRYPALLTNDDKPRMATLAVARRALADPFGFAAYMAVALAVKTPLFRAGGTWARGR